jgi:hypothetical protein
VETRDRCDHEDALSRSARVRARGRPGRSAARANEESFSASTEYGSLNSPWRKSQSA